MVRIEKLREQKNNLVLYLLKRNELANVENVGEPRDTAGHYHSQH